MAEALLQKFVTAVNSKNLDQANEILGELNLATLDFASTYTNDQSPSATSERKIVLSMLKYAVLLRAKQEQWRESDDEDGKASGFENAFSQYKVFSMDNATLEDGAKSPTKLELNALNLLRLLIVNKLMEFHMELELLTFAERQSTVVSYVVGLEQALAEGSYHKVLSSQSKVPYEPLTLFLPFLKDAVRNDVANCSEKAYDSLSIKDAQQIMFFENSAELKTYISNNKPDWEIKDDRIFFKVTEALSTEIPSLKLISQSLSYANELERIV